MDPQNRKICNRKGFDIVLD